MVIIDKTDKKAGAENRTAFDHSGIEMIYEAISTLERYKDYVGLAPQSPLIANSYKKRFLVKYGDKMQLKRASDIGCFYAEGKTVYLISMENNRKYLVDHTLEELESQLLDPKLFFRINRKFIISIDAIADIRAYANSRLKVNPVMPTEQELIVSRQKVNEFKKWIDQ